MHDLKRSRFNVICTDARRDGQIIGYNALTGVFAILSEEIARTLLDSNPISKRDDLTDLVTMGFLHVGDELSTVESRWAASRPNRSILRLTLVPTMDCNRRCPYCIQAGQHSRLYMSEAVQNQLLCFLERYFSLGVESFDCSWFGGEPLLAKDTVISLSHRISELASAKNATLREISLITNGTLLTVDTAKSLAHAGVKRAQISIDSLIDDGRYRRGIVTTKGSPSTIMRNLVGAASHLKIIVRVNVSPDNLGDIDEIQSVLINHGVNHIYLSRTRENSDLDTTCDSAEIRNSSKLLLPVLESSTCSDQGSHAQSLTVEQFAHQELQRLKNNPKALSAITDRLTPRSRFCSATAMNMYVIEPKGNITRCWESVGRPEESVGTVYDDPEVIGQSRNSQRWSSFNPTADQPCMSCQVLPLCMGGCSHKRVHGQSVRPACQPILFQIEHLVREVASRIEIDNG